MQRCAFTPYEGNKPYIFISYAHKDSNRVFPILEELDRRGYRIWYDDGIAPGSEWPENIAQHLDGCSLTLAFISPASIASANCRREVTFALSKRKPFLGILLEPTEMSLGMELQLSAQQCIMKYTYPDEAAFFSKICSCPDLQPCLGQPKVTAQPAPVPASAPVLAPASAPTPVSKERKPMNKKLFAIIGGAAAALVILTVILVIALSGSQDPGPNLEGTKTTGALTTTVPTTLPDPTDPTSTTAPPVFEDETVLSYSSQTITADDISYINRHPRLENLEFHECVFDSGVLEQLTLPNTMKILIMTDCQNVSSLQCLAPLENLELLKLTNDNLVDGVLPVLRAANMDILDVSGNPKLSDLSVFAACTSVTSLHFSNTSVEDIAFVSGMEHLSYVDGSHSKVFDVTPLCALKELLEIRFTACRIQTIGKAFCSLYLKVLDLSDNNIESLEAFENCTVLEQVYLAFNQLESVYPLSKTVGTLRILDLSGNTDLSSINLSFLKNSTYMQELYVDGVMLFDLDMLANVSGLERLSAVDCYLSDINGLEKSMATLHYLNLSFNHLSDISVLAGSTCNGLCLDLSFNDSLNDLSALSAAVTYEVLNVTSGYWSISTLPALQVTNLVMAYHNDLDDNAWLKTDPCSLYAIVDCPMDKMVAFETMLGRNDVTLLSDINAYIDWLTGLGIDCRYFTLNLVTS